MNQDYYSTLPNKSSFPQFFQLPQVSLDLLLTYGKVLIFLECPESIMRFPSFRY